MSGARAGVSFKGIGIKKNPGTNAGVFCEIVLCLFYLIHDGLEGVRVIHGQIGKYLAVQRDLSGF